MQRTHRHFSAAILAVSLVLAVAGPSRPAAAQLGMHPMPDGPRGLADRLAEADVVVIATVTGLQPDRIELETVTQVRGAPPARFQVKRSPARSPKVHPGQRALWLLRGARTPYVLVDDEKEFLRLGDEDPTPWIAAIRALDAAGDKTAVQNVYLSWIDGDTPALRQAALDALRDTRRLGPPPASLAVNRAEIALDPAHPAEMREASALIAIGSPAGAGALVAGIPPAGDIGASLIPLVVQAASLHKVEGAVDAVLRCLVDPRTDVRLAGLDAARLAWSPAVAAAVKRVAAEDESDAVRKKAAGVRPPRTAAPRPAPARGS